MQNYCLVDVSSVMYVYLHGTFSWYKENIGILCNDNDIHKIDWSVDKEYMGHFNLLFFDFINWIKNDKCISLNNVIFALDCNRKDIWRNDIYPAYKANRSEKKANVPNFGTVFEFYKSKIFPTISNKYGILVVSSNISEADDIITVLKNKFRKECNDTTIYIVSGDSDLKQLMDDNTTIINPKRTVDELTNEDFNVQNFLLQKILTGDRSDNIPPCFAKVPGDNILGRGCGEKTALRLIEDKNLLKQKLRQYPEAAVNFKRNKKLIVLSEIPDIVVDDIEREYENAKQKQR